MNSFLRNNLISLVVLIIVSAILYKGCNSNSSQENTGKVVIDTVWIHTDTTILNSPQIIKSYPFPVEKLTKEYLPDTNYDALVKKYMSLVDSYLATNVALDSIRLDSVGYVKIIDSITKNSISHRSFTYDIKYPVVTVEKTIPTPVPASPKRQLYIGGGFSFTPNNTSSLGKSATEPNIGLMYKDKKDHIIGINAGINDDGFAQYGVSAYIKIGKRN